MSKFWFCQSGETLPSEYEAAGFVAVVSAPPPSSPSAGNEWVLGSPQAVQNASGTWVPNWVQQAVPLAAAQQQALATVEATLAAKIAAGLTYIGVTIAIDPIAQGRIHRIYSKAKEVVAGTNGVTWNTGRKWPTMTPGVTLALPTAQDMVTMALAAVAYVADLEFYAVDLTDQIENATSASAVQSILSGASWPTS